MSEVYRGGKVPKSLDRATRRLLEDHDRMLVRGIPVGDTTVIVQGKSDVRIPASPVRYVKTTLSGNVTNIPIERAGTVLVMAFNGGPTLKSTGGNLHLSGDFTPQSSDETITLVSDGVFWREMSRGIAGWQAFIPVGAWGVKPDVAADMSTRINEAFDECPLGATLYFPPGTYTVSNPVVCDRSINIWAEGAIFDFGANLTAGEIGMTYGGSGGRIERCFLRGLKVQRTYTGATWSTVYTPSTTGLSTWARSCTFDNVHAVGFDYGVVFDGAQSGGCDYNVWREGTIVDCRYQLVLHQGGTGYVNENTFENLRHANSSSFAAADLIHATNGSEYVWLKWDEAAAGTNSINNNRFLHCTYEGNVNGCTTRRKVRVEGNDNYWIFCRWERNSATFDITIGKATVATTDMTGNTFMYGAYLDRIVNSELIEFLGTASTGNNRNSFYSRWGNYIVGGNTAPAFRVHGANATDELFTLNIPSAAATDGYGPKRLVLRAQSTGGDAGSLSFFQGVLGAEVESNYIGMDTTPPYDIVIAEGLAIGGVGDLRPATNDLEIRSRSGSVVFWDGDASNPTVKVANTGSSNNDSLVVADSARVARLTLKAQDTGISGVTSVIKFHDDDGSATLANSLGVSTTQLPAASGNQPLKIDKGIIVNNAGVNSDTQIQGENDANCLYVDASKDSVGIGTASPAAKLHVVPVGMGTSISLRVDGTGTPGLLYIDGGNDGIMIGAVDPPSDLVHIKGGTLLFGNTATVGYEPILVSSSPYNVTQPLPPLLLVSTAAARTINLPAIGGYYRSIIIKDNTGNALTNNITVVPNGAETIDGDASLIIDADWASVTLLSNGASNWGVI